MTQAGQREIWLYWHHGQFQVEKFAVTENDHLDYLKVMTRWSTLGNEVAKLLLCDGEKIDIWGVAKWKAAVYGKAVEDGKAKLSNAEEDIFVASLNDWKHHSRPYFACFAD